MGMKLCEAFTEKARRTRRCAMEFRALREASVFSVVIPKWAFYARLQYTGLGT